MPTIHKYVLSEKWDSFKTQVASDDGLPQNVCMKCIADLKAAFAYKAMCEDSDRKLRSLLWEHELKVKLERFDARKLAEQESKADTDEHHFEVTWFPQIDTESPELGLSSKEELIAVESTDFDTEMAPSIAEATFVAQAIDEHSTGFDSLNACHEPQENDFEMSVNDNWNGVSDIGQKQDVRSE